MTTTKVIETSLDREQETPVYVAADGTQRRWYAARLEAKLDFAKWPGHQPKPIMPSWVVESFGAAILVLCLVPCLARAEAIPAASKAPRPRITKTDLLALAGGMAAASLDAASTQYVFHKWPASYETNPLQRPFVRTPAGYLTVQTDVLFTWALATHLRSPRKRKAAWCAFAAVTAIHAYCAIHNYTEKPQVIR